MNHLQQATDDSPVTKSIRVSGTLWNELVMHLGATSVSRSDSMQAMLTRWIEAGLRREQQELEGDSEESI